MYSARPFASSAFGNTSIEPPRSMASFSVPVDISLRDPRIREGNLRCIAVGPTQQLVGVVVFGVDLDETGARNLSCDAVEDFLSGFRSDGGRIG